MTEWTTIRVRQDKKDKAEELKPDGVTWSEWIADEARAPEPAIDPESVRTIEERTGRIERLVEESLR